MRYSGRSSSLARAAAHALYPGLAQAVRGHVCRQQERTKLVRGVAENMHAQCRVKRRALPVPFSGQTCFLASLYSKALDTSCFAHKSPCFVCRKLTHQRALMGRGPVPGAPQAPREGHCQGLQVKSCPLVEIGISALRHAVKPASDALKPSPIRRAVSTLVYATLLHPVQALLPMNLQPPESAGLGAGGLAGACRRRPRWSRFNRQDDHHRAGGAAPSCRRCSPA